MLVKLYEYKYSDLLKNRHCSKPQRRLVKMLPVFKYQVLHTHA